MFAQPLKRIAAHAATLAAAGFLSACAYMDMDHSGLTDGVRLSELDMSGPAPTSLALLGPDDVILSEGDTLDITVEGDANATEALRFERDGGDLAIGRAQTWSGSGSKATIRVTMPPPREIALAGSGSITAPAVAPSAELDIAGSGSIDVAMIEADRLEVNIGGSGIATAAGRAKTLEVSVAGSGDVRLAKLMADTVEISIAGSGDVELGSDGTVEASIAGSGDVVVRGNATCSVSAVGSGTLTCKPSAAAEPATALAQEE